MIACYGERARHRHERRAVERPRQIEHHRHLLSGSAAVELEIGDGHRLASELHPRDEAAARQAEHEAAQFQRAGLAQFRGELVVAGAGLASRIDRGGAQPVAARRHEQGRHHRLARLQIRGFERRLRHQLAVRVDQPEGSRRQRRRRIDRFGDRHDLDLLLPALPRREAGDAQRQVALDRGLAQELLRARRAPAVGAIDAQRRADADRDVRPRHLELDALDAAVALRGLRLEGHAVEGRGLAEHAREGVVFGAAEGQAHAAGHAGQVVEAGNLVADPDRLDDVEPRAGIRGRGPDLTEVLGQQRAGGHAALRADGLLVRADHAGGKERHGHRERAADEAFEEAAQRVERPARPAGHVVRGLAGRGLADDRGERGAHGLLLGREAHPRAAVGHRDERDAIGRRQLVEKRVGRFAQRPFGTDPERVIVHDQHERARLPGLHVRAERRRQRRHGRWLCAADDVDEVDRGERPGAAAELQRHLFRLEIGDRPAIAADRQEVERDEADAALQWRRLSSSASIGRGFRLQAEGCVRRSMGLRQPQPSG